MKKRYLSLCLAAVLLIGQIVGTVQPAQASEITEESGQLGQDGKERLQEVLTQVEEQFPKISESEGAVQEEQQEQSPSAPITYELEVDGLEEMKGIWPGETATIKPAVYRCEPGKEPEVETGVQYQFEYEEDACKIWRGETGIEEVITGVPQEGGAFTAERVQNGISFITIRAFLDGKELCYKSMQFQEKDYNVLSIEGEMGKYIEGEYCRDVIFDRENLDESDEYVTFTVNTEKLGGIYGLEWRLPIPGGRYEIIYGENGIVTSSGEFVDESVYEISGENNNTITIDLQALQKEFEKHGKKMMEDGYGQYGLNVVVKAGGREQAAESISLLLYEPKYTLLLSDLKKTREMWINSPLVHEDGKVECFIRDKEYPSGLNISLDIEELKILSQEPEDAGSDVFTVKKEGNDIVLVPENCGQAVLGYQVILPSGQKKVITCERRVIKDKFETHVWSDTGIMWLLPGEGLKLKPEVWYGHCDGKTGTIEWEKIGPESYHVAYKILDENKVIMEPDGTIRAKEGVSDFADIELTYTISLGEGKEYICNVGEQVYITDTYTEVIAKEIVASPGDTIDIVDWEIRKFDSEHKEGAVQEGWNSYYLLPMDGITLNEEKTGFIVNEKALERKWINIPICVQNGLGEEWRGSVVLNVSGNVCQHNFIQKSLTPATCTTEGTQILECSKCGKTKTETIPLTGHKTGIWATTKEPTCTAEGTKTLKCSVCHAGTKTEPIPATGHKAGDWIIMKEPSCIETGIQTQHCASCGIAVETKPIPATGHSFGAWKQTKAPTALKKGTKTRICSKCKAAEKQDIKKLKAKIKLNVKSIPLQVKKSTTAVKVTSMAKGDSIKSWKSNKPKIASVTSKGKITGKKVGTAKIKVTLKSNVSATVTVKVQKKAVTTKKLTVTGKSLKKKKLTLKRKKSVTLKVTRTPVTSTEKITYQSSNKKIATVSKKGKITAKKAGKAKITVKSGKKKVTINVTVKK